MARPRELHKLGKWLYLGVRARVRRLVQGGGGPTLDYFTKPDKVYLASADQFKGMEPIVEGEGVLQCRHFYSVVGGMGGLNILARLKNLDTITFFDINPHAVEIGRLVVELIKHAPDRDTFVSLIYGRLFDGVAYDVATQDQYYALPIEPEWTERVLTAVGPDLFKLYQEAYSPYIENPLVDQYEGISVHCTRLPLYHDAPIDGVMTHPFVERSALKEHRVTSVNSFFYGKGWLKDEARYQRVRQHLLSCEVSFAADSLEALNPPMHSGLYTSNILGAEPSAESYAAIRAVVEKFMWMLWYSHATNYLEMEYAFPPERLIPLERVYGAGIRDTHHTCEMVLDDCFDLNAKPFLEVIQPHATYGMEFGFRFYDGQRRVSVRDFLAGDYTLDDSLEIVGIHILLGGGCSLIDWRRVVAKAVESGKTVFLVEHRKVCGDWPEVDVNPDLVLSEQEIDRFVLTLDGGWHKLGAANIHGSITDVRNLFWILRR